MSIPVILDCDPGMDDSMAIVMAAKSPELDLKCVTTVSGNYPVDLTTVNALKVVELLGKNIPVARGMDRPMVRPRPSDPFTHGKDGQAENNLPNPISRAVPIHAVQLIIDTVKQNPGEIVIIATGPLSNVAMAFRMAPEIIPMVKKVVAISGMFGLNEAAFLNATGDTPQSEWNVYVDPEAAKIVYESGVPLFVIGLDVATHFDVDFTDEDLALLQKSKTPEAVFFWNAIKFVNSRGFGSYCACIDCMAVAAVAREDLVVYKPFHVAVSTDDGPSFGMTIRDGRHHFIWENLPVVQVAVAADYQQFLLDLKETVIL